jgi:hypothetical protein
MAQIAAACDHPTLLNDEEDSGWDDWSSTTP